jgi:hypothetical protein
VKLRDDPSVINPATLKAEQLPVSPEDLARAAARQPGFSTDNAVVDAATKNPPPASDAAQAGPPPTQQTQPN